LSHYIVNHPLKNCGELPMTDPGNDYMKETQDMELNKFAERHVFYTLTGTATDMESVRRLARRWLEHGRGCTRPESIAGL
jgi:hypothetical protein